MENINYSVGIDLESMNISNIFFSNEKKEIQHLKNDGYIEFPFIELPNKIKIYIKLQ